MSEVDKFFDGLPSQDRKTVDIFEKEADRSPAEGATASVQEEETVESRKNRRERRRDDRDKRKDDMIIALNNRVIELSTKPTQSNNNSSGSEMPPEWIALYGDTPEAEKAWNVNRILIDRAKTEAKTEAVQELEAKRNAELDEQKKFESFIDTSLEDIEDQFNVDLTSNAPAARKARREFLELVQDLSPKDDAGSITGYADFGKTFEIYQKSRTQEKKSDTTDRQKELASRSMARGNSGGAQEQAQHEGPVTFDTARQAISRMLRG